MASMTKTQKPTYLEKKWLKSLAKRTSGKELFEAPGSMARDLLMAQGWTLEAVLPKIYGISYYLMRRPL